MEIRIGIIQSAREITLELDDEKAQSKFKDATEAALAGKTETLTVVDSRGREIMVAAGKITYVEFGAPEGARKMGFGS